MAPPAEHAWAKAIMWMVIVLILVGGAVYGFKSCHGPVDVVEKAGQALANVAAAFKRGTVTTSFVSYATTLSNTTYLQFATLKQMEIFRQTEAGIILPDVIVEARVPVEYTYYIDFNAKWQFLLRDNVIHVLAPPIRSNKPAVDASAITYEAKGVFTGSAQENLRKMITGQVAVRARDNIPLVRESGRKQTAEFVEKWLSKSFTDGKEYPVKVYFPGEALPGGIDLSKPLN